MTQTSNNYTNGVLFSAAAFAAPCAADLIHSEMQQEILDQEAKKMAQECQATASKEMAVIAVHIGEEQQAASVADGWANIGSGIAMGGAELGSAGYSGYRSNHSDLTHPTEGLNTKIENNKKWRDILEKPEGAKLKVRQQRPALQVRPTQNVDEARGRLENHLNPDSDPANYPGGISQLRSDVAALKLHDKNEKTASTHEAREKVKQKLDENKDFKRSFESETDDKKSKLKTLGQISGQLATGAENMEKGRHQELEGEQNSLKQLEEFVNTSARGNADGQQRLVEQRQSVKQGAEQMFASLIQANHV